VLLVLGAIPAAVLEGWKLVTRLRTAPRPACY
jgi:hypothetical protein